MTPTTPHLPRARRAAVLVATLGLGAGLLLAACGDDGDTDVGTQATDTTTSTTVAATSAIEVEAAWARTSPMVVTAGAAYMEITNAGAADDALLSASVADTVAATVELHETRAAGMGEEGSDTETSMGGTGDGEGSTTTPMMEMVPVDRIEVPAGETVSLEPGGYHVMLLELVAPLEAGDEIELTLTFEVAGELVVTAVVGDSAP
jgi:copper(I)-binding protein